MMDTYIGTKIVQAEIFTKNGEEGYRVIYADGYESWSPRAAFENSYRCLSHSEWRLIERVSNTARMGPVNTSAQTPIEK